LAPIQIALIPVDNQKHNAYCQKIKDTLKQSLIRVEYYNNDDRLSKKIRDAQMMKIPYQLVIGDNEVNNKTVSYRKYGEQDSKEIPLNDFVKMISEQIKSKLDK
jgi:threonyl-tRNA synthetase